MNIANGFIGFIVALLLALVFLTPVAIRAKSNGANEDASPTVATMRVFPLPSDKTVVIDAVVNRGPLPPVYQAGYEITIDATGHAVITVSPLGSLASTPTAKQRVITREIGVTGLQALLNRLSDGGYFRLNQLRSSHGIRVGGPGNVITITLADGKWTADAAQLSPSAVVQLQRMQDWIAEAVGFQPPPELAPEATPGS